MNKSHNNNRYFSRILTQYHIGYINAIVISPISVQKTPVDFMCGYDDGVDDK